MPENRFARHIVNEPIAEGRRRAYSAPPIFEA